MYYISTRNKNKQYSAEEAIVKGIADDGGLFVPEQIPTLSFDEINALLPQSYAERSAFVMQKYLSNFSYEELIDVANKAYSTFQNNESLDGDPVPVCKIDEGFYILELWHGKTHAFKDVALSVLPHLLVLSKKKLGINTQTKILVATSGDTGKAALEGFCNVEGTSIDVFFPSDGVSNMQKLQMLTQDGDNVRVYAIKGNFDDCQTAVKTIFNDKEIAEKIAQKNIAFSSANSINFGRLLPQIVYYISAYCDLLSANEITLGEKINFCVPTGNFGDILAGWYAFKMGLPISKLICASNCNNVLTDFFSNGTYDANRKFHKTYSPSMDILISSNLERLLFEISDRNDNLTAERMNALKENKKYQISKEELDALQINFSAEYATEDDTIEEIADTFEELGYVLDPHTAVAVFCNQKYIKKSKDTTKCVVLSTANPCKFPQDVLFAISGDYVADSFRAMKKLHELTAIEIPASLQQLKTKEKRFNTTLTKDKIGDLYNE